MRKKITSICSIVMCCVILTGCFNYKDIDNVLFVTTVVFDIDDDKNIVTYLEAFQPIKSMVKGQQGQQRLVFRGTGKTAFESLNDINIHCSYELNYTQVKAYIYSEKAAKKGIKPFIDLGRRKIQFYLRPYVATFIGNIEELMKGGFKENEYVGLLLSYLIINSGSASRAVELQYNDFLNKRIDPNRSVVMTAIDIRSAQNKNSVELDGGAIFRNDKLIDKMDKSETEAYNFMIGKVSSGSMEVLNPATKQDFISLWILNSRTTTKGKYYNGKFHVKKIINVNTALMESQSPINYDKAMQKKVEENAEKNIINNCNKIFTKYKEKNEDIFNVRDVYENIYKKDNPNIIKDTVLEIEPHVEIQRSGKASNFK
ncbi:spore gernimation protein [Clostridium acetobutylicum]|nr:spore gernimation protein [Clostridium acetobutylicum]